MHLTPALSFLFALISLSQLASGLKLIESKSLTPCANTATQNNADFTATLFNIAFTPENRTLNVNFLGVSSIDGYVTARLELYAYGYPAVDQKFDPCDPSIDLKGLCPMSAGPIELHSNILNLSDDIINKVPGIAYNVPDIDAKFRAYIYKRETGATIACFEGQLSNAKTVYHRTVGWIVAVIAGIGLVASAITSGLGHSNTAAHVAANALSLFSFLQAQAMIGLTSVTLPPVVQAWTQNFQWSMGIIHVGFIQRICTWYQRATGGTPATVLDSLTTTSIQIKKRSMEVMNHVLTHPNGLTKRVNNNPSVGETINNIVLRGIDRVAFKAKMETTNFFMTGLLFFVLFVTFVVLLVTAFKGFCELAAKNGWMKTDKFQEFRNGWKIVMRGILFRLTLIGFPQMSILCLWEFTQVDSPAIVILAVFMLLSVIGSLSWAAFKVISLAKKSVQMHKNPAYILYSDPSALNKWGFLYVQYRATAYYCVVPLLGYILIKSMFIGLAQKAPYVQAISLLIIELAVLIGVSILRPWMDKKTNIFNISIAAVNFFNVILLLFFSEIFKLPGLVVGVMGVAFFVINAVFALILLILVLIASGYAMLSKNPDTRYQPMRDDRGSFIKSQTQLTTELDALGATARGEGKFNEFEDDSTSLSGQSNGRAPLDTRSTNDQHAPGQGYPNRPPHSPVDPSVPLFPSSVSTHSAHSQRTGGPQQYQSQPAFHDASSVHSSPYSHNPSSTQGGYTTSPFPRTGSANPHTARAQNNASPWQRGAGYD
ncbi:putative flavin carrier protein 3 [Microsporum audouinii]